MTKVKTLTRKKMIPAEATEVFVQAQAEEMKASRRGLQELEKNDKPSKPIKREAALSIVGGVTTKELNQALKVQTEQRQLIQKFIKDNLVDGIDYGKIHVVKGCQAEERQRGSCNKDYHYSKSILFKPGQEKIFSLFGITDELVKDEDAYEMLQGVSGLVAYKCIMHRGDKRIGEGRGAATLAGSQNDPNSTIKKAEKRARMDACLSLGFSAYFTQDLDDPEYAAQREMANSKAAAEAERRDKDEFGLLPRDPESPISNQERQILHRLVLKAGFSDNDEILELLKINGVKNPQAMTSGEARAMMGKLAHSMFAAPERAQEQPPIEIEPEPEEFDDPPLPPEPTLVIDDDLKTHVQEQLQLAGLNTNGLMWFMAKICGRPFAKWEQLNDEDWRRAYDLVMAILEAKVEVSDHHLKGFEPPPAIDPSEPMKNQPTGLKQVQAAFPGAEEVPIKEAQHG